MSIGTYRKYGLFTALAMVVGSVVGIGIFIKNDSIFEATDGNGVATLLAWIIGGVVSLLTALSFAEITKSGTNSNGGLSEYARVYLSKRFSKFLRAVYPILYFSLLQVALAYFTYLFFMAAFSPNGMADASMVGAAITVMVVVPFTVILYRVVPNLASNVMGISLIVKFIPLLLAALVGLWVSNNGGGIIDDLPGANYKHEISTFDGALIALPSVLFAFDAFVGVGSIARDVKNPKKTIPLAVGGGMIFVAVIYLLITISQLQQNSGTVAGTIASVMGSDALSPLVNIVIVLSACGTYTSMTVAGSSVMQDSLENDILPFSSRLLEKYKSHAGAVVSSISTFIFGLVLLTMTLSFGNGEGDMINAISNMPTLFFFVIYSFIIIGYVKTQIQMGERGWRSVYLITISLLASISILFIVGYQFYALIDGIVDNGFLPTIMNAEGEEVKNWGAFSHNLSLILYPALLYLVPVGMVFVKQKFEYKNKLRNSITRALRLKFM